MIPVFRTHKSFFFENSPPKPYHAWSLAAFSAFCRIELSAAGFDFTRKLSVRYEPLSGNVVFWQEPEFDEETLFVVSEN